MQKMKKFFALIVAAVMVFSMATIAFAAGTGSITITPPDGVSGDVTYTIYKVFDADGNGTNISYKLVAGKTEAPACFTVDAAGNVTYAGGADVTELSEDDIAAIAGYVTEADKVATVTASAGDAATAENLPNGYYYITTTAGTVVTIDSTNPNATVADKNVVPDIDKTITGASSYDANGKKAIQQVGQEVEFTATVTVGKGQIGYVFKDTMSEGLSYVEDSLAVEGMTEGTDYTLTVNEQNITIEFKDDTIKQLDTGEDIVITYKATVTSAALQEDPANNTATISFGTSSQYTSEPSQVEVYNARLTVSKMDGQNEPLAGAGFIVMNSDGQYYFLRTSDGGQYIEWLSSSDEATVAESDEDGKVTPDFTGLADGTYTLIEKVVPSGYNRAENKTFTISASDTALSNLIHSATVFNQAGSTLPSTGGIGTTIFYVVGAILVVGAGVVLITRRRMSA